MKTEIRIIYSCDHCKKMYKREYAAIAHEKWCAKNPNNQHACFGCAHLQVGEFKRDHDSGYGTWREKTFHCALKNEPLHSFKAEKIGHDCLIETTRMPLECDLYQPQGLGDMTQEEINEAAEAARIAHES